MKINKNNLYIIEILFNSIKNIFEPNIFKWILCTVLFTIVALGGLSYGIFSIIKSFISVDIPFIGGYIDNFLIYSSIFVIIWGSTVLFVPLSTIIFSIFQEYIIKNIELKYYPETIQKTEAKTTTFLIAGLKLLGWTIIIHIFLFPLAIFFGGAFWWAPLIIIINGYLLSKEYFEAVGLRRFSYTDVKTIKNNLLFPCWLYGLISAILFLIPIINLFVPAVLTLTMLHLLNKNLSNGPKPD